MSKNIPVIDGFSNIAALGSGGAGIVFSAIDDRHNRRVAIKVITFLALDQDMRDGFTRELHAMGALSDHPNITTIYQSGFTANTDEPYLVMPLFVKGSYKEKVQTNGPLGIEEFYDTAVKVLSALATAHNQGILHRDIKPENIFVGDYGNQPKLGDFGVATLSGSGKTTTNAMAYTVAYAPPEVLNDQRQTAASDIYSLGATFYVLLTCAPLYIAQSTEALITKILTTQPEPLPDHIPSETADLIMAMLSRNPADRPQTCQQIAEVFQAQQMHPTPFLAPDDQRSESGFGEQSRPGSTPNSYVGAKVSGTALTRRSSSNRPATQERAASEQVAITKASRESLTTPAITVIAALTAFMLTVGGLFVYNRANEPNTDELTAQTVEDEPKTTRESLVETKGNEASEAVQDDAPFVLEGHTEAVLSVAWSPDGKTLATGSWDDTIKLWNTATGENTQTFGGHSGEVASVAWAPVGTILATGSADGTIKLWNASTGENTETFEGHTDDVLSVSWSPDGTTLATGSADDAVKLWNVATGDNIQTFEGHARDVSTVAWSPDGKMLATGSWDRTVKVWDPTTGDIIQTLEEDTAEVSSMAWSPDGNMLATGSWDRTVKVWDPTTGDIIQTLEGHTDKVFSVAWSPDGGTLASGSLDGTAKVWSAPAGDIIQTLDGHTGWVEFVAWSLDGETLATADSGNTAKLWNTA